MWRPKLWEGGQARARGSRRWHLEGLCSFSSSPGSPKGCVERLPPAKPHSALKYIRELDMGYWSTTQSTNHAGGGLPQSRARGYPCKQTWL